MSLPTEASPSVFEQSPMGEFARSAELATGRRLSDFETLWRWSVEEPDEFWGHVWSWFEVPASKPYDSVVVGEMPTANWFSGGRLNYADLVLRHRELAGPAVIALADDGTRTEVSWGELAAQVDAFASTLRRMGVQPGDRVAGYLTAGVEAVVAFLGTASVGAIWAACGPDYGAAAARDRLAQLRPVVLVAATSYSFGGKQFDRRDVVADLTASLGVRHVVEVPRLGLRLPDGPLAWAEATAPTEEAIPTLQVGSEHPLWVLFSSGTTGIPKGIVHSHAGISSVHLVMLGLHWGLQPGQRMFWYSTTNWMMWNLAVSCLTVGATFVTYEGSPTYPRPDRLWEVAAHEEVDVFGVSPGYLQACANAGATPGRDHELAELRNLGVTGSPLPPALNEWVAEAVSSSLVVGSTSGGTDIASGLLGSAPGSRIRPGELAGPILGVAVDVWDTKGQPVLDEVGELVVTRPLPSMPVYFWDDSQGDRYRDAYFDTFPGVWRQGDWATRHSRGGFTLHGRSDSTLNRGGVRFGSADIYAIVEAMPEVEEALVIGVELPDGRYRMPMFLVLSDEVTLDDELVARISARLRTEASPRHVPDAFHRVPAIPHTRTGKKLEVPIKRILQGADPATVVSPGAVDNPSLLDTYVELAL